MTLFVLPGLLAAALCSLAPAAAQAPGAEMQKRIFAPAPLQWSNDMLTFHRALQQTPGDFTSLTGGFSWGMSAAQANALLPDPYPAMSWSALALANEYPGEARYFSVPLTAAGTLNAGLTACIGNGSYLVLLFSPKGLFRLSYRLLPDRACPATSDAAQDIFARYVPMDQSVALSIRYHVGRTEVVDITDATAGYLIPTHWRMSGN